MSGSVVAKISLGDIAQGKLPQIVGTALSRQLLEKAQGGDVSGVKRLLKSSGINVNAANSDGYTALIWAAYNGQVEVVKELLGDKRTDVNAADSNGNTALILAAKNGQVEVAQLLVDHLGLSEVVEVVS